MADIIPFQGIHYDTQRVGGLARVVAPPYDVISAEEQAALYGLSEYNVVRVILNRPEPGDGAHESVYTRAGDCLRRWLADGALVEDPVPALYLYEQAFADPSDGGRRTRTGLFCALKLEPYSAGVVLPHEETRPKAREDRLQLMRALRANPEPIFALYEDGEGSVARAAGAAATPCPALSAEVGGDLHQVFPITDASAIEAIRTALRGKRVWIADGHHRYETALAYSEETGARTTTGGTAPPGNPAAYIMVVLSAFEDPGLVVLPTHRMVRNVPAARLQELHGLLERHFAITPVSVEALVGQVATWRGGQPHRFGLVLSGQAAIMTLRDATAMDGARGEHSAAWGELDVSILQALVLGGCLGFTAESVATTADIAYTRDAADAAARVQKGEFQLAFLLGHPAADEVRRVAAAGDKMPPKSTFFYPKLWSGLLMRRLDGS